ncbi:hypothetical protein [Cellulomonas sp.]|uniref:hypothetical protein n=1 Tax=Cellulomonas sp. TaxID=40001 RepID=UPI00281130BE|nr:hypothetical protein [Cellulomonas sp.]
MVELTLTPEARRRVIRTNVPPAVVPGLLLGLGLGGFLLLAGRTAQGLVHVLVGVVLTVTPFPHRITPAQLRAVDPHFVAAWRARPGVAALVAVLALLHLVAVVVVVAVALLVPA